MATKTQQGGVRIIWDFFTLDFPSAATLVSADLTGTLTGAAIGDVGFAIPVSGAPTAGLCYQAFGSAADTVTVRQINASAGTLDTASQSFLVALFKLNSTNL